MIVSCRLVLFLLTVLCAMPPSLAFAQAPAMIAAPDPAVTPTDRLGEGWWRDRHRAILATVAAHPDPQVVLIGDSITNNYDKATLPDENFQPTWQTFYAPRAAMNLGFSGDTAANVLWRLQHGEVDGLHPRVVVLLIGTNDTGVAGRNAIEAERGIDAVVADLEMRLPATKILLLGILPSAISDAKSATDETVDRYLAATYGLNPRVTYLDIGSIFLKPDGSLDPSLFYDPRLPQHYKPLHPDTIGQRLMAEAIEPTLATMLGEPPRVPLGAMTDVNTALIPVPRLEQDSYDWYARHQAELALAKTLKPSVVMIGDSITHFWAGPPAAARIGGAAAWRHAFGDALILNLGFGWDRTQNVLWRLRQGEFDGMAPGWVVINIGTNNLTGSGNARANTPAETVAGIEAIVRAVQVRSPASRIVLMAIFPRGRSIESAYRGPILATNRLLARRFGRALGVTYLDIGASFLTKEGTLPAALMPDETHPSDAGYAIWADALIRAGVGVR